MGSSNTITVHKQLSEMIITRRNGKTYNFVLLGKPRAIKFWWYRNVIFKLDRLKEK